MSTQSELRPRTQLRRHMIGDLQLAGQSERTQEMYVRAVRQLAQHYQKSPDQITQEQLREYFLHIRNVKQWWRTGITIALCGIKFFYEHTLQSVWPIFNVVRPHPEKKLPVILSREEVREILGKVRLLRYRTCLATIYSCGLRLKEGTHLQVGDVDGRRRVLHIHHGKGNKEPARCPFLHDWPNDSKLSRCAFCQSAGARVRRPIQAEPEPSHPSRSEETVVWLQLGF